MDDLTALLKAIKFSAEKHRGQRRKGADSSPYINHPIEVAEAIATIAGVSDLNILIAAILHDTLEDTLTTPDEIESAFGRGVRLIVQEVTDDKSLPKPERKRLQVEHASHASNGAHLIKIADKMSNVRDIKHHPPAGWPVERQLEYLDFADRVVAGCRGVSALLEASYDEVACDSRTALSFPD
jgi:guanosine-3',5'-bis(diphosphate) 3'-pyrophosphohydrolase